LSHNPIAFMSYVRVDDQHEGGQITQLLERLSGEVRMQTGQVFEIFQDRNHIAWGQQWKERFDDSLDEVTFFIPVITPAFFFSPMCREELERFLKREEKLGRTDLILPVYYVECATLSDEAKREKDQLAKTIATRQYADWRGLRFEPFTSPEVGKRLAGMARQIIEALERSQPAPSQFAVAGLPAAPVGASRPSVDQPGQSREVEVATVSEPPRAPAPKTEVPMLVVDALYRGDHATLTAALAAAQAGTRILVRPGLYKEGVVIDKPVEIVGDGEQADVVIEASGENAILFQASMGRVANLTLRQTGGGDWFCVNIAQGRLDLEGCDITSRSLACVAIHDDADPRLRRNRIYDGTQSGVFVYDNGRGTLEDNEIFANANAGVAIKGGANPTLRRNRIHDGKVSGVLVYENGQGTLEDNEIFANTNAGVAIKGGGNPTLRRNHIHDGRASGVFICADGQGTLEDNEIFANGNAGVSMKTGGNPTLCRNRIHDGRSSGVFVYEGGQGTLEDNEIFANALAGVQITADGIPTLRRNRIYDGKGGGVVVNKNGQGTLEDNEILANANAGVFIESGGNPTLRRNRISKNSYEGIWVAEDGGGVFEENDLRGNARGAWDLAPGSETRVKRENNRE